jgi:putative FmdB family regulatory protein
MPLFEYVCRECNAAFEKIVPSSRVSVRCDRCDSAEVEKQLSVFAVGGPSGEAMPADGSCGRCGAAEPGMCQM